jgi:hypothetical protein
LDVEQRVPSSLQRTYESLKDGHLLMANHKEKRAYIAAAGCALIVGWSTFLWLRNTGAIQPRGRKHAAYRPYGQTPTLHAQPDHHLGVWRTDQVTEVH